MIEQPVAERRIMRRFDMHLPASVHLAGQESGDFSTETQNVSAQGIFFYLDRPVAEGTPLEITMTFPSHITLTNPVSVRFAAKVVRVEAPLPVSRIGIAATIENYEFLRTDAGTGVN